MFWFIKIPRSRSKFWVIKAFLWGLFGFVISVVIAVASVGFGEMFGEIVAKLMGFVLGLATAGVAMGAAVGSITGIALVGWMRRTNLVT